jgi:hypothetical protein
MADNAPDETPGDAEPTPMLRVRRIHRRDLNRVWDFLKLVFREVNRETVEYQRPRSKKRFLEVYEEAGVEQLVFELEGAAGSEIVGYAECAFEVTGSDNWINESFFIPPRHAAHLRRRARGAPHAAGPGHRRVHPRAA